MTEISSTSDFGIPTQLIYPSRCNDLPGFLSELLKKGQIQHQISIKHNQIIKDELEIIRKQIEEKVSVDGAFLNTSESARNLLF
mmetsp:Transcript_20381/g.29270  ORF Transcript_20381/g.29270 Transcript_20381/m.29270 type:complete len:84 (+) Transcript_20381:264-515(+)